MEVKEKTRGAPGSDAPEKKGLEFGRSWSNTGGFIVKLLVMLAINGFGIFVVYTSFTIKSWAIMVIAVLIMIAANVIYFSKKLVPMKYLFPGLLFLFVFQVFVFA